MSAATRAALRTLRRSVVVALGAQATVQQIHDTIADGFEDAGCSYAAQSERAAADASAPEELAQ